MGKVDVSSIDGLEGCQAGNCADTEKFEADSAEACAEACAADAKKNCEIWTFASDTNWCFMFKDTSGFEVDPNHPDTRISGRRACVPPEGQEGQEGLEDQEGQEAGQEGEEAGQDVTGSDRF